MNSILVIPAWDAGAGAAKATVITFDAHLQSEIARLAEVASSHRLYSASALFWMNARLLPHSTDLEAMLDDYQNTAPEPVESSDDIVKSAVSGFGTRLVVSSTAWRIECVDKNEVEIVSHHIPNDYDPEAPRTPQTSVTTPSMGMR
ncbi:MAG: hypothetical protein ABIW82_16860 [Dokdonella sp.]